MKRLKNLRQGHTRWKLVVYSPGQVEGYDDRHVAAVYGCAVTAVHGTTVHYCCGLGSYICGRQWFMENTFPTYRKAVVAARAAIAKATGDG